MWAWPPSSKGAVQHGDNLQQATAKTAAAAYALGETFLKLCAIGDLELATNLRLRQGDGALRLVFELQHFYTLDLQVI